MKSLRDVVETAMRMGYDLPDAGMIDDVVDALMQGIATEAGREHEISIELGQDKVYAEYRDVDDGKDVNTFGDAEHVAAWVAERLGVSAQDAKRRLAVAKAKLQEERLAAFEVPLTADIDREKMSVEVSLPSGAKIGEMKLAGGEVEAYRPSLPKDVVAMAKRARRDRVFDDVIRAMHPDIYFDEQGREKLAALTTAQLEQVLLLAKP